MQNSTNKLTMQNHNQNLSLINAYGDLYFYFRSDHLFRQYILNVGHSQILLAEHMIPSSSLYTHFNKRTKRIYGKLLHLFNELSGMTLANLEGKISKITGPDGHGGIANPKFPRGKRLIVALARLAATVLSDGSIESNGVVKYGESEIDRINKVMQTLRLFGDINPEPKYVDGQGHYILHFPAVIGKLMMFYGLVSGDKAIQNPGVPLFIMQGSIETRLAYLEELIPQDGSVGRSMIIWTRANVLKAGNKKDRYNFATDIEEQQVELIKQYGKWQNKCWSLSWGKLVKLAELDKGETANIAKRLKNIVLKNPNRLINDEAVMARSLGINIGSKPYMIRLYPKTGRVSVAWQARTQGIKETIKLGILAPPNDSKNRKLVRELLRNRSDEVEAAIAEIIDNGFDYQRWWVEK